MFHGTNLTLNYYWDQDTFEKVTKRNTHGCQEASLFPTGDHKSAKNRKDSTTDKHEALLTKTIHKRSTALEWAVKNSLEGLIMLNSANLNLNSNVDQGT